VQLTTPTLRFGTVQASWITRYKEVRDVILYGDVHLIGAPDQPRCAVQYTRADTVVVLAWNTGHLDGNGLVPSRPVRLPLHGLVPTAAYRAGARTYSGSHLATVGLPVQWTPTHDAELVVLHRLR
jgi:alpha-galactosidase